MGLWREAFSCKASSGICLSDIDFLAIQDAWTSVEMDNQATAGVLGEFQTDFVALWRALPNKGFFFALTAAWLALFQFLGNSTFGYIDTPSLFRWMYNAYVTTTPTSDDGHGIIIPFLVLALFWWKRRELLSVPLRTWWPGLGFVAAGLVFHVIGYITQQPRISVLALFVGIYGLMGLAWGRAWLRSSIFPFFLFLFCIPLGSLAEPITFRLRLLVCYLVEILTHYLLGIDVIRVGTQLLDPSGSYQYEVAAACSGIRSLVAIFLLATVYGFMTFRSAWQRGLIMASAVPFAVLGNLLRMLLIIVTAAIAGQQAGNFVHENTLISLVPYVPAILGLLLAGRWLGRRGEPGREAGK